MVVVKLNFVWEGLIWHEIKQIYHDGLREYLRSSKNIVNSTMNVLYLASFGMKYYTIIEVSMGKKKIAEPTYWSNLVSNMSNQYYEKDAYNTLYWLNSGLFDFN